jgi:hypothetical protein
MVRCTTKGRSISAPPRFFNVSSHPWHHAVIFRLRAICMARNRATNSGVKGGLLGQSSA